MTAPFVEEMTWEVVDARFKRYLRSCGKSPLTCRTYASNVSIFWRWCSAARESATGADRATIRQFIGDRGGEVSSARAHNDLAALRHFFAWLIEEGERKDNPTENIRVKRRQTVPTKPLTSSEVAALLAACTRERDRLMLLTLASTGIRISELAGMRASHIDWERGTILITGKGDKQRIVAPAPESLQQLRCYVGMFPDDVLWQAEQSGRPLSGHQIRKIIYDVGERAKVDHVHPHRFRSAFATKFLEQHKDIQALQGVMGHESIETTARYTEWTKERRGIEMMRQVTFG